MNDKEELYLRKVHQPLRDEIVHGEREFSDFKKITEKFPHLKFEAKLLSKEINERNMSLPKDI